MTAVLTSATGITLVGGGAVDPNQLAAACALAPLVAAADSGADTALSLGVDPMAVIGDLDSLSPSAMDKLPGRIHRIDEQDSTDFEKCLRRLSAPFIVAVGFGGPRVDHALAAFGTLVRRIGPPTVLMSGDDVVLACPPQIATDLPVGTRLSLFPMGRAIVRGTGLRWPTDGIVFAPDGRVGTSNEISGPLRLAVDGPMLLILPACHLRAAVAIAAGLPPPAGR